MALEGIIQGIIKGCVGGRAYPMVNTSPVIIYPYGTYQIISKIPAMDLGGADGLTFCRVQIDICAKSYGEAKATAKAVKTAMAAAAESGEVDGVPVFEFDRHEEVSEVFVITVEYELWEKNI